jgi:ketosteroid isomerase-like protein
MDGVIGNYAPDAVTVDLWAPGVYRGRKAIHDSFNAWLVPVAAIHARVVAMNVASDGDMACALMQWHFDTSMKDGSTSLMGTRSMDAFRRNGGKWEIVQEQIAWPLSPSDGLAVTNATVPAGPVLFAEQPLSAGERAVRHRFPRRRARC